MKTHKCALFRETAHLYPVGAAADFKVDPAKPDMRQWTCIECQQTIWLDPSIDPNPDGVVMTKKAKPA